MTDTGILVMLEKLVNAPTRQAQREVWGTLADKYANQPGLKRVALKIEALKPDGKRSLNQNALLHKWFDQIAKRDGDKTAKDVKGEQHHKHALDIRLRDEQFAWVWAQTGAKLSYEQQCALLASETLGMSSQMTIKEMREYMDAIHRDFPWLPVPEDRQ